MISNIARAAIYIVAIAVTKLVSTAVLSRQGKSSGEVKPVPADDPVRPMGVDNTYTNLRCVDPPRVRRA